MNEVTGSFDATITSQTISGIPDVANHDLALAQVAGTQSSADANFDGAALSYWGVADLIAGSGSQKGYFVNTAPNGDRNWGTFEGSITTSGEEVTLGGVWQYTGGTGTFSGVVGNGSYHGTAVSPTVIHMEWEGEYKL
jgi:hypothetical protein